MGSRRAGGRQRGVEMGAESTKHHQISRREATTESKWCHFSFPRTFLIPSPGAPGPEEWEICIGRF